MLYSNIGFEYTFVKNDLDPLHCVSHEWIGAGGVCADRGRGGITRAAKKDKNVNTQIKL